jgi:DegV family protein with EDD domain
MTQSSIAILTDSTCDIPEEMVQQYGITVLPHRIIWGTEQFLDRIDITPEQFYTRLVSDPQYPSTAHVTVPEFAAAYQQAKEQGALEIIVATVSSAMSGAYHSALSAIDNIDIPVHVVDSKGPTMSLGWQVLAAARAREVGADVQAILNKMDEVRKSLVQFVGMDSLEYLYKGGRIGNATRLIGSLMNIKPLVFIDHITGLVESAGTARTHNRLVDMMVQKFFAALDSTKPIRMAVLHGNALVESEALAKRIQTEFNPMELIINMTGPVLGVNTGPRALALCGYNEG